MIVRLKSRVAQLPVFALASTLAVGILVTACGRPPDESHKTSTATLPWGAFDSPRAGEVLKGTVSFQGWALGDVPIQGVNIYADRKFLTSAQVGVSRPDVASAFPASSQAATSGWTGNVDTTKLSEGKHEFLFQIRSAEGATKDLGPLEFTVAR